jgi:lysine N6-hydroxylase
MLNIDKKVYDIISVGIGPFNLGMAAMVDALPQLDCIFFDQSKEFNWHAGMLLPNAGLQVPFYADLITVVDPCSKFTYLNYLKEKQMLFRFAIHENNFITRREYNDYCKWVIGHLDNLHFHHRVVDVHYDAREEMFTVMVHNLSSDQLLFYYAKHLVIGVGSVPNVPSFAKLKMTGSNNIIHSSDYLFHKDSILEQSKIAIVGSGQSAAEIFYDLLNYTDHLEKLSWFTRSTRFYPMEYSKLSLEMTSPDYIDHFYSLPAHKKKDVLKKQDPLYKGINYNLINEIYDALYLMGLERDTSFIELHTNCELNDVSFSDNRIDLRFTHSELEERFEHNTNAVILATGYRSVVPSFLDSIKDQINFVEEDCYTVNRNYSIDVEGKRIFVQNAELHSHGFSAPDLGMGPYRNAAILNSVLGYEQFVMERNIAFQKFGIS